jgi:hypothetical protein
MLRFVERQNGGEASGAVTVNVYVSSGFRGSPRLGVLAPNTPVSLLPRTDSWKYVRSTDAFQLGLSETDVTELHRSGFWTRDLDSGHPNR